MAKVGLVLVAAATWAGCLPIPNRIRDTPEVSGQILERGKPLARAELGVLPRDGLESAPPSCAAAPVRARTDDIGAFSAEAHRRWLWWMFLLGESPEWRREWWLCVRPDSGGARWRVAYKTLSNTWEPVRISCDLAGRWAPKNLNGSEGLCGPLPGFWTPAPAPRAP